jgi:hypothetical protein
MELIGALKFRKIEKEVTNGAYWSPKIQENRKRGHQGAYWRNCFQMMRDLRSLLEFMSALKREELP